MLQSYLQAAQTESALYCPFFQATHAMAHPEQLQSAPTKFHHQIHIPPPFQYFEGITIYATGGLLFQSLQLFPSLRHIPMEGDAAPAFSSLPFPPSRDSTLLPGKAAIHLYFFQSRVSHSVFTCDVLNTGEAKCRLGDRCAELMFSVPRTDDELLVASYHPTPTLTSSV